MVSRTFEVGLVLSGTVSSGAYTAGVLDFLFEALNCWSKQKLADQATGKLTVPDHEVVIKVVAGNSGGALTACLIPGAILGDFVPFRANAGQDIETDSLYLRPEENRLYDSWVRQIDIRKLLDSSDLNKSNGISSLLNCDVVEMIADNFTNVIPHGQPTNWIADDLHFYLMFTNLDGIPYSIDLNTGSYYMRQHGDYEHYVLSKTAPRTASNLPLTNDNPVWLDSNSFQAKEVNWLKFRTTALASGSFPLALKAQTIERLEDDYQKRLFSIPIEKRRKTDSTLASDDQYEDRKSRAYKLDEIKPSWVGRSTSKKISFTAVDGGVVNNDPLEYSRLGLTGTQDGTLSRAGNVARQASIMVSPLNGPPLDVKTGKSLVEVIKAMLPCFLDQTRFKLTELGLAQDKNVYSRYLISPADSPDDDQTKGLYKYPIYCSILSAFGGFFLKDLRNHDYLLGRRNCQQFLLEHFDLPVSNDIVKDYAKKGDFDEHRSNQGTAKSFTNDQSVQCSEVHYRIIPLLASASKECIRPARLLNIASKIFEESPDVKNLIKQRISKVSDAFVQAIKDEQRGIGALLATLVTSYSFPLIVLAKWFVAKWLFAQIQSCFSDHEIEQIQQVPSMRADANSI